MYPLGKARLTPICSRTRISSSCHVLPFENDRLLFRLALCITTFPILVTVRRQTTCLSRVISRNLVHLAPVTLPTYVYCPLPDRFGVIGSGPNNPPAKIRYRVFCSCPSSSSYTFRNEINVSSAVPSSPRREKRDATICCLVSSVVEGALTGAAIFVIYGTTGWPDYYVALDCREQQDLTHLNVSVGGCDAVGPTRRFKDVRWW
jgi:hypothetical protein